MHRKSGQKSISKFPDFNNNTELKCRGRINCRSRLGIRNSVRMEIQQILMDRFRCNGKPDPEHPAWHRDLSK
ncbi:MAG: hypothetical protein SRB2_04043 [Desulfobacteraceae bacterium Eth-SRB2]|nr:MAG: hypothetical protein SRB2_04043 [Desulfobacteraceae bacterium Eth-SRB2]